MLLQLCAGASFDKGSIQQDPANCSGGRNSAFDFIQKLLCCYLAKLPCRLDIAGEAGLHQAGEINGIKAGDGDIPWSFELLFSQIGIGAKGDMIVLRKYRRRTLLLRQS